MEASFEEMFRREHAYVHRTLLRLGVAPRDAEDGIQDVFLTVHAKWPPAERTRTLRPWLFAFAYRYACNYRRLHRHRRSWDAQPDDEPSRDEDPEAAYRTSETKQLVLDALSALPEERRVVFVACELDELSAAEAGAILDLPEGTVRSRLRAAREEFVVAARRVMARRSS